MTRHQDRRSERASVSDLVRAMGSEIMPQSGLFRGRAGFLAGLAELSRHGYDESVDGLIEGHVRHLGLHELRPAAGELHYPSASNYRISSDRRTWSAGVLTAVAVATGRRENWLPGAF
jgi:hypothetical protein